MISSSPSGVYVESPIPLSKFKLVYFWNVLGSWSVISIGGVLYIPMIEEQNWVYC